MCGRFALSLVASEFADVLGVPPPEGYRPRWNVAPDSPIVIVRNTGEGDVAVFARWGFLPPWTAEPNDPGRQINARLETAAQKPMFRAAFVKGRCLVPATGFYEWQKQSGGRNRPFFVRRVDRAPVLMAGLWRRNRLTDGSLLETVAILTRPADPLLAPIHHRMPVVLPARLVGLWLATEFPVGLVDELLRGAPDEPSLEAFEIGRGVNDPRSDHPGLVEPVLEADPPARLL
ncbi:MAG: SOS response-associated peptidase [Geminicoccaceae bacterium]|nr:SOS response-associated peptidase [Geminicoccaceae bacterium]